jgi:hypothetical protein
MDSKEAITKIKVLLGLEPDTVELQFAEATLVDGTTVRVEGELEAGKPLFVVGEEGEIPAPAGQHETTTGMLVTVDDNGMITEVTAIEVEAEEEEETEEVQMEEEVVVEMTEDDKKKVEMADALVETLLPYLEQIDEMKEKVAEVEAQMAKMSAEPAAKRIKRNENFQDERSSRVDRLITLKKTK